MMLSRLQQKLDIKSLGELDNDTFDEFAYLINDKTEIKRARHAVSENQRTLRATQAMKGGDFGGSAIAIVKKSEAENFKKNVGKIYRG